MCVVIFACLYLAECETRLRLVHDDGDEASNQAVLLLRLLEDEIN